MRVRCRSSVFAGIMVIIPLIKHLSSDIFAHIEQYDDGFPEAYFDVIGFLCVSHSPFINYDGYSLLIPYDVLNILGEPQYVQISWQLKQRRIVLRAANKHEEGALDVPEEKYENSIFALPEIIEKRNPIAAMGWGDTPYSVEARLVRDHSDVIYLMIDLKTAKPADTRRINGAFITPECIYNEDDEEWFDWEDPKESL